MSSDDSGLEILATSVWVGGLVAIAVVPRVATRTLDPGAEVAFFRALGRTYGVVGTLALALAYGAGAALLLDRPWDALLTATAGEAFPVHGVTSLGRPSRKDLRVTEGARRPGGHLPRSVTARRRSRAHETRPGRHADRRSTVHIRCTRWRELRRAVERGHGLSLQVRVGGGTTRRCR